MPDRVDLRDDVTAFVIATDEPDLDDCLESLEAQNSRFRLRLIENVAPMDRAFQMMLDLCRTPLYVQVDADMILQPGAVLTLVRDIQRCPAEIAEVCYPLLDPHLGHLIIGIKVYRHDVCVRYPYETAYSCEVGPLERMMADGFELYTRWPTPGPRFDEGFTMTDSALVLGEHSPTWTPAGIFERYKRLAQKWKRFGYLWIEPLLRRFQRRIVPGRPGLDLWAYNGMLVGLAQPTADQTEADFRKADEDFTRLEAMLW